MFTVDWHSFTVPVLSAICLLAGGRFYRIREPRLAVALHSTAALVIFTAIAAPVSYMAAAANCPLIDAELVAFDHALGFDRQAWQAFIGDPWPLRVAYASFMPQCALAVPWLAMTDRMIWLKLYMRAFYLAALASIAISTFLPSMGMDETRPWFPIVKGLRDGTVRTVTALGSEGIITFPSLHAALAVILAAAFWPTLLRWPMVALNAVMMVSCLSVGGHYLADVLAGVGLAALCLAAASALAKSQQFDASERGVQWRY